MRKKKQAAMFDIADDAVTRLQSLKRNPEFSADIRAYNNLSSSSRRELAIRQKEAERLSTKWKLAIRLPITSRIDLEQEFWVAMPVRVVKMSRPSFADQLRAKRQGQIFTADELAGRFLSLEIDTNATIEDLMPVIEKTLRDVYRAKRLEKRRRRPAEAAFQLRVFDLAREGEKFSVIARKSKRPVTTVKSAVLAAIIKIFGEQHSIDEIRLAGFTPERHCETCATCKKAGRLEDMCMQARNYLEKDRKAQREMLGFDTTGELRRVLK
jgi:hypothetical protein